MFQRNRTDADASKDGWQVCCEIRQDSVLVTDHDTMEFVRAIKQSQKPPIGAAYPLSAELQRWRAQGVRIGRTFSMSALAAGVPRVNLSAAMYGQPVCRKSDVHGTDGVNPAGNCNFDVVQRDANTRFSFLSMKNTPAGTGVSLSLATEMPLTESITAKPKIDDLLSRLWFLNLPVTEQRLSSAVATVDQKNRVNIGALWRVDFNCTAGTLCRRHNTFGIHRANLRLGNRQRQFQDTFPTRRNCLPAGKFSGCANDRQVQSECYKSPRYAVDLSQFVLMDEP